MAPDADAAAAQAALGADAFARAFPFHLHLDAALRLRQTGHSLCKALPELQPGTPLLSQFIVTRPRAHGTVDDWRRHGAQLCTLRSRGSPALTLRGNAEPLADGSVLLLVAPVLGSIDEVQALGLGLDDFAKHDAAADLLLLARTSQMSALDAERLADRLRERTTQLGTMLSLSDSAVAYFDHGGRLLQANTSLSSLLGVPHETLVGSTLEALRAELGLRLATDEAQRDPLLAAAAADDAELAARGEAASTPEANHRATPLRVRLAAPRPRVVEIRTRRSPDGGRVFFLRDVTHDSEVDRMKSEFLSAAAHELRTPMASIFGFTELLLHRRLAPARQRELLQTIHGQTAQLIHIVNELLDLARIESRQGLDLQREPCALGPLIEHTVSAHHLAQGQRVRIVDGGHGPTTLLVDAGKFAQALGNVLSNAFKFSPPGAEIVVDTRLEDRGAPAACGVRVSDPGTGMTPEERNRVFERFYRADPSRTVPGSGLGMSLVKEIVELHGGRVDVESEPGRGTRVTLWWPLAAVGEGAPARGSAEAGTRP